MKHAGIVRDILRRRLSAILKGGSFTSADNLENYFYRTYCCRYLVFKISLQTRINETSIRGTATDLYRYILQLVQISVI